MVRSYFLIIHKFDAFKLAPTLMHVLGTLYILCVFCDTIVVYSLDIFSLTLKVKSYNSAYRLKRISVKPRHK